MSPAAAQALELVRSLPEDQQYEVLDVLNAELENDDSTYGPEWEAEMDRRRQAYHSGEIKSISLEEFETQYQKKARGTIDESTVP